MSGTTQETQTSDLVTRHYQQANQFYQAGNYQQAYQELRQARQHAQDQTQIEHIEKNIRELEGMMQEPDVAPAGEAEQPTPKREPNKMAVLTVLVGLICLTPIVMKCIEIFSQPAAQTAAVSEENSEASDSSSPAVSETNAESPTTPEATPNVIVEEDVNGNLIPAGAPEATISGDSINLRESPSTQAAALGTLSRGQRVTLLANASVTANGYTWSQVQTAAGASGWIASQFVQSSETAATSAAPAANTADTVSTTTPGTTSTTAATPASSSPAAAATSRRVSGTGISLRGTPSTSGALLTTLSQTDVTVLSDSPVTADGYSWTKVRTRNGSEGWIASQFLN